MIETSKLLQNIKNSKSIDDILELSPNLSFHDYLNELLRIKHIQKSTLITKTTLQRNYAYQIFDGTKTPSKDKVIQIALALRLDLHTTNNLLSLSNNGALYPKVHRDAIIIYCIEKHEDVFTCNELLVEKGFQELQ